MDVVVTIGAVRRHHQQTNTQFFYGPDATPVAQPAVSEHWRKTKRWMESIRLPVIRIIIIKFLQRRMVVTSEAVAAGRISVE